MRRFGWLVGIGLFAALGVSSASASLMPVSSARLAAGLVTVASCDVDGVTVSYTSSFDTTTADYLTTAVTVSNVNPSCAGKALKVTVRAASGVSLFQGSATLAAAPATSITIPVPLPSIRSSTIAGWAVTVTG